MQGKLLPREKNLTLFFSTCTYKLKVYDFQLMCLQTTSFVVGYLLK